MEMPAAASRNGAPVAAQDPPPQESTDKNKHIFADAVNNLFLVVAIALGTMAYNQALNPPTGLREADPENDGGSGPRKPGSSLLAIFYPSTFTQYMFYNTVRLISCLLFVILQVAALTSGRRLPLWISTATMWIACMCTGMTYKIALAASTSKEARDGIVDLIYFTMGFCTVVLLAMSFIPRLWKKEESSSPVPSLEV